MICRSCKAPGTKFTQHRVNKTKLIFQGDTFEIPESEVATSEDGTVKIDVAKMSKQMDAITGSGLDKGKTWLGIYEIEGDNYKVCFSPPGKERPSEFSSKPGSGHLLQFWKRERSN
jgi:uncharacterized protein (TIGR03067 family)